jgi:hypothetical protein
MILKKRMIQGNKTGMILSKIKGLLFYNLGEVLLKIISIANRKSGLGKKVI